jgi:hypothetical protein
MSKGKTGGKRVKKTTQRTFGYSQGECKLSFTLNTNSRNEMEDFLAILKEGVVDVQAELGRLDSIESEMRDVQSQVKE